MKTNNYLYLKSTLLSSLITILSVINCYSQLDFENFNKNNLENINYYDGMHMTTNGIKKLLNLNKHY